MPTTTRKPSRKTTKTHPVCPKCQIRQYDDAELARHDRLAHGKPLTLTEKANVFYEDVDPMYAEAARKAIAEGKAAWGWDPWVANVAGLLRTDRENSAYVVVYADNDWECSDDFETLVYEGK